MANVGFATLSVIPSLKGIESKLKGELGAAAGRAGTHAGGVAGANFSSKFGNGLKSVGKAAAATFAGVGALAVGAGAWGLKVAAANEQAEISFTTMLGSAQKAGAFLGELQAFAAKTPFEFPELQTAASSLISAGVEASKVIPIMTTLGDVTSGMGTGSEGVKRATIALQQMSAAGRITGEDLNQLRDAGIPVFDLLAAATGKSKEEVVKLAQSGKLGAKELGQLMKALESGKGLERFAGLMDKQSESLSGMVSTLKDTLGQGLARAMKPMVEMAKNVIPKLIGPLGDLLDVFGEAASSVLPVFAGVLDSLVPVIKPIAKVIATLAAALGKVLVPILDKLAPFIGEFAEALGDVLLALVPLIPPIGRLLVALAPILPILARLTAAFATLLAAGLGPVIDVAAKLVGWITQNKEIMIALGIAITAVLIPGFILWATTAGAAAVATLAAAAPLVAVVAGIALLVVGIIKLAKNWGAVWNAMKGAALAVWKALKTAWDTLWGALRDTAKTVLGAIKRVWETVWGGIKTAFQTVWSGILNIAGAAVATLIDGFRFIANVWLTVVGTIIHGAATAFGWVPGIGGKLKAADKAFNNFKNSFLGTLETMADKARGWGASTGKAYAAGLNGVSQSVIDAAHKMGLTVQKYLQILSPAELGPLSEHGGPEGWGRNLGETFAAGIRRTLPELRLAAASFAAATMPTFTPPEFKISITRPTPAVAPSPRGREPSGGAGARTIVQNVTINTREDVSRSLPVTMRRIKLMTARS